MQKTSAELPDLDHAVDCLPGAVIIVSASIVSTPDLPCAQLTGHELELLTTAVSATTITNNITIIPPAMATTAVVTRTMVVCNIVISTIVNSTIVASSGVPNAVVTTSWAADLSPCGGRPR